ncbi:YgaP-like transmembrane domain [Sorangium sp. So ce117]
MKRNVGTQDRLLRVLGALALLACAWAAPLPLAAG